MKNSLTSIFLFIILVCFLFYADINFKNLCSQIIDKCELMEYEITPENKEENFKDAMEIFTLIKDKDMIPSIYINHVDYDVLLNEALKLSVYIEEDDIEEAEASLHLLKFNAEHLRNLQNPTLNNIF